MSMSNPDRAGIQPGEPVDPDIAEQAEPHHGVPSQDPSVGAQVGLTPEESERESKSAYVGGGAMAGLAAGAAVGAVAGGPVGVLVGGMAGAIAGVLGGEAAGSVATPEPDPDPASDPLLQSRTVPEPKPDAEFFDDIQPPPTGTDPGKP